MNLQREILDYFIRKSTERSIQFLIATHAEEFVKGVDVSNIVSLLQQEPKRISSTPDVLRAMAEVSNEEVAGLLTHPHILYVEGEDDERILRAWASECGGEACMDKIVFKQMHGGTKETMKREADEHFAAVRQIIPEAARLMLFDYDDSDTAFHPDPGNESLFEWQRKNIENYLLVPGAWRRAALTAMSVAEPNLLSQPAIDLVDSFFVDQNLTLPPGRTWRSVTADIFKSVNGKRILYANNDSLFQRLRSCDPPLTIARHNVAVSMKADDIHDDVHVFFAKLRSMTGG